MPRQIFSSTVIHSIKAKVLMDEGDRSLSAGPIAGTVEPLYFAAVGLIDARQDLDQRRFARAILPEQGQHLAASQLQADLAERFRPAEPLRDFAEREDDIARLGGHPLYSRMYSPTLKSVA